jgi:spermidine synthase
LQVAREFCGFEEDARMRVFVEDGRDFLEDSSGQYDLLILDCFGADSIPAHLSTLEFLAAVRKVLAPEGLAVANVWGRGCNPLYAQMLATYRAAFPQVYVLDVPAPGTKIFLALQCRKPMTRETLVSATREISRVREFTHDVGDAIAGFRDAEDETVRASGVLRD